MSTPVQVTPGPMDRVREEIRVAMARKDWSQADLARRLGTNEDWVSRRLLGKTDISVVELLRIADALGVKPCSLLPQVTQQHSTVAGLVAVSGVERRPVRLTPSMPIAA